VFILRYSMYMLSSVSSVLSKETVRRKEFIRNDLSRVEWDVKPQLSTQYDADDDDDDDDDDDAILTTISATK